jgi:uncharacterized caspase-like protein
MLRRVLYAGLSVALGLLSGLADALAKSRVALVLGNSAYQKVTPLPNPANDARAISAYLKSANFEVVEHYDLTQSDMRAAIGRFADTVSAKGRDTVVAVYYAGHGLQVDGENYLVPIDAHIAREADVPLQTVRLADLMNALAAVPSRSRVIMLDACRNNPFSEINKVAGRGLAIVDAPPGTIISYSTSPGSVALDGDGANSPYATALLAQTKEPGLPVEQAFKRVRFAVNDATNRQQLPWESSSLTSDFSFFGGDETPAVTQVAARAGGTERNSGGASRSLDAWKKELQRRSPSEAYEIVIKEDSVAAYQAFLEMFPNQANSPRVREVVDRRRVTIAWYTATTTNTPGSYQAFLGAYANSDFAATAQRLMERANTRSILPQMANTCPCALPEQPRPIEQRATRSIKNKKEAAKAKEKPSRRARRSRDPDDDDAPRPQQQQAVPVIPLGIGIGIGGMLGGSMMGGGRTYGGRPPMGSSPAPMGHTPRRNTY